MENLNTDVQKMLEELNQYMLPSTLMECFDAWREEAYKQDPFDPEVESRLVFGYAEPLSRTGRQKGVAARSLRSQHVHRQSSGVAKPGGNGDRIAGADLRDSSQGRQGIGIR